MVQKKKSFLLLVAALSAVGILAVRVASYAQDSHNGVLLYGSRQNAGTIPSGAEVRCEVKVFNSGLLPVSLSAEPDCGCTLAGTYDHTLLPLGLVSVPFTISTDGVKAGLHTRTVQLRFLSGKTAWKRDMTIRFRLAN